MLTASQALESIRQALARTGLPEAEVYYHGARRGLSRFANTELGQNTLLDEQNAIARVVRNGAVGNASTSDLSVDGLLAAIGRADAIAKASPPVEGFAGLSPAAAGPAPLPVRWAESTAAMTPEGRAALLAPAFERVRKAGLKAAGVLETTAGQFAFHSTTGLEHAFRTTAASFRFFALGPADNVSGFGGVLHRDIERVDIRGISEAAVEKCLAGKGPTEVEPGDYDVVLEPFAVTELLEWLSMTSFGAREVAQGTSCLAGREDSRILGENVTLYDSALEEGEDAHGIPFDREGTAKERVEIVKNGVALGPVYDRTWGRRLGKASTGHASVDPSEDAPAPANLYMQPGRSTVDEMVGRVERGLYVTRFHYVNGLLDPRSALMTGMTRDGTFLIENGKKTRGVRNIRFTESILKAFGRIEAMSKTRVAVPTWWSEVGAFAAPALLIRKFRFTGDRAP